MPKGTKMCRLELNLDGTEGEKKIQAALLVGALQASAANCESTGIFAR